MIVLYERVLSTEDKAAIRQSSAYKNFKRKQKKDDDGESFIVDGVAMSEAKLLDYYIMINTIVISDIANDVLIGKLKIRDVARIEIPYLGPIDNADAKAMAIFAKKIPISEIIIYKIKVNTEFNIIENDFIRLQHAPTKRNLYDVIGQCMNDAINTWNSLCGSTVFKYNSTFDQDPNARQNGKCYFSVEADKPFLFKSFYPNETNINLRKITIHVGSIINKSEDEITKNLVHELGHIMGFLHEINPSKKNPVGLPKIMVQKQTGLPLTIYDANSVMLDILGQVLPNKHSALDIAAANLIY